MEARLLADEHFDVQVVYELMRNKNNTRLTGEWIDARATA